jgi:hypothetical protein
VGDVVVAGDDWGAQFRSRYGKAEGASVPIVVRRNGTERTVTAKIRLERVITGNLDFDPKPSAKAVQVRKGLLSPR